MRSLHTCLNKATVFNQNINTWQTSKVAYHVQIFDQAKAFNQPLDKWNTESMTALYKTFSNAQAFNQVSVVNLRLPCVSEPI